MTPESLDVSKRSTNDLNVEDNETEAAEVNDKANRSSAQILADTASDMTNLLRRSTLARSQQQPEYNESHEVDSQHEPSESGSEDVIDSLKSFHNMFNTKSNVDPVPGNDL